MISHIPQNSDNKPWSYICSKGCFAKLIFGGAYFWRGLLLEGILRFKMGWAWHLKQPLTLRKQLKTVSTNNVWVYIWEDLLLVGFLHLKCVGLIFGRGYYQKFTVYHYLLYRCTPVTQEKRGGH